MRNIKTKVVMLLTLSLVAYSMLFNKTQVSAASDPADAPANWAFEESSIALNDALVAKYSALDNGDGFVTIPAANAMIGELSINGSNITGTLNGIENFTSITKLHLFRNQLTGEIPSGLSNLNNLKDLNLHDNQLTGTIPSSLGDLSNLKILSLSNNELSGEIPNSLSHLSNLTNLYLNSNKLSGEIPSVLGDLSNLVELNLGRNELRGEIPNSLDGLSDLYELCLQENQLGGEIPSSLGNLSSLALLRLHNNQLTGTIPSTFGDLDKLTALSIDNNKLSGEIPSFLGDLSNLIALTLGHNQLSGEIPSVLGELSNLYLLDLSYNQLSGELPNSLSSLSDLYELKLQNNQLSGEVPSSFENLSSLSYVNLSNNHFTSISLATYNFLESLSDYSVSNQTYTDTLTTVGIVDTAYQFDALPAYEQFTNYGITFEYDLTLPDGTTSTINPSVVNGKVTIEGSDLSQVGSYTLVAGGTSINTKFTDMEYTTHFSIENSTPVDEAINYLSANANGEKDKVTSSTITIDLSKTPNVGELTIGDVSLTDTTNTLTSITKDSLTSLGNGKYELAISGTWDEGTVINVVLTKTDVVFTPNTHFVTLHAKLGNHIEGNENNSSNNNTTGNGNAPETGDSNFSVILLSMAGLLISGGYLAIRRKEQK